ncbi:MAG: dockerin type I domain-containing protein [Planctomycetota bacterium]|nr:dockerin type I domain-containing protein [Planctomycetota bacterium]
MRWIYLTICLWIANCLTAAQGFDLQLTVGSGFTPAHLAILTPAAAQAEAMWEAALTGYQPGINIASVPITIQPITTGLANANYTGSTFQGGYWLTTSGIVRINTNEINNFANWQGPGANGFNFIDEILAHEVGHALGIGTHWINNSVYTLDSFQYTGAHGVAAFQAEFNPAATFVPVEDAGGVGAMNYHWDQLMRSSTQEGNPSNPYSLDPRLGITDQFGHDFGLELLTAALDPDYGQPFISRTTIQSMRDIGYTVAEFEDLNQDGSINSSDLAILTGNLGMTGLGIDSFRFGDINRDRMVDAVDLQLMQAAVPEPATWILAALGVLVAVPHLSRHGRGRRPSEG